MEKYYLRIARAPEFQDPKERLYFRLFEILPGSLTWLTFVLMVATARFYPAAAAIFIILFDTYWFLKTIYLSLHLREGFKRMQANQRIDWLERLHNLVPEEYSIKNPTWRDLWHLVVFPMYQESYEVVRTSFQALVDSKYPLDRLIVVLSAEERAGPAGQEIGRKIQEEFSRKFGHFLFTTHPAGVSGEIAGKASNEHWAAKEVLEKVIKPQNIPYENVIVSVFDVDTAVFPGFFGCLAYHYLTVEKPLRSSFQPIPLFINNVWQAPAFARVMGFSSTFWQLMQQARPERLITFSSHSLGLKPLVEIGLWQTN
ncbi:MAG: hypothetical protein HYW80_01465, partial [Parcubacteria group bacterium]|nr:hypothetical protein [Parcubacteria group bacterium]